jgi:hypothetical protein
MRELVLEAEKESTELGQRLLERHVSRPHGTRPAQNPGATTPRQKKRKPRVR